MIIILKMLLNYLLDNLNSLLQLSTGKITLSFLIIMTAVLVLKSTKFTQNLKASVKLFIKKHQLSNPFSAIDRNFKNNDILTFIKK